MPLCGMPASISADSFWPGMAPVAFCAAAGPALGLVAGAAAADDDGHHDEHGGGAQHGEQRAQAPAAQRGRGVGLLGFDASGARGLAALLLGRLGSVLMVSRLSAGRTFLPATHGGAPRVRPASAVRVGRRPLGGNGERRPPRSAQEGGDPAHVSAARNGGPSQNLAAFRRRDRSARRRRERRSTSNQTRQPLVLSTPQRRGELGQQLQAVAVGLDVLGVEARSRGRPPRRARSRR